MTEFRSIKGKQFLREITPPILYKGMRNVRQVWRQKWAREAPWGLRPAAWYDVVYAQSDEYGKHYSDSIYYFLWAVIADRIRQAGSASVLDLGCGPGQFASLLRDLGLPKYRGLDFSDLCIARAKAACPEYDFEVADLSHSDALQKYHYDCVVALEFLEHVEDDRGVLQKVGSGSRVIASVPNFPDTGHVRHFADQSEVEARYGFCFESLRVDTLVANATGKKYFLLDGIRV